MCDDSVYHLIQKMSQQRVRYSSLSIILLREYLFLLLILGKRIVDLFHKDCDDPLEIPTQVFHRLQVLAGEDRLMCMFHPYLFQYPCEVLLIFVLMYVYREHIAD